MKGERGERENGDGEHRKLLSLRSYTANLLLLLHLLLGVPLCRVLWNAAPTINNHVIVEYLAGKHDSVLLLCTSPNVN